MLNWIKKLVIMYIIFGLRLSMILYKAIYLFLDKFIPDGIFKTDHSNEENIFDRDDVFSGEKFPDDFFDDDEFMDKEVDDFKEILTVIIMMIILVLAVVLLIKSEIWLTKYAQQKSYMTSDVFDGGLTAPLGKL